MRSMHLKAALALPDVGEQRKTTCSLPYSPRHDCSYTQKLVLTSSNPSMAPHATTTTISLLHIAATIDSRSDLPQLTPSLTTFHYEVVIIDIHKCMHAVNTGPASIHVR